MSLLLVALMLAMTNFFSEGLHTNSDTLPFPVLLKLYKILATVVAHSRFVDLISMNVYLVIWTGICESSHL